MEGLHSTGYAEEIGTSMLRRKFILGMGLASVVAPLLTRAAHAGESKEQETIVDLLFVQSAQGAELADGKLKLKGVSPSTIFFSDRPERITGHVEARSKLGSDQTNPLKYIDKH